jgi:sugar phosphate isomerase/epimerase
MKIACSSAGFSRAIAEGSLTQLEWLDLCANELEVDGVVFDRAQFPRTDDEYLAQLKKLAVDLGLTVAALSSSAAFAGGDGTDFALAMRLGAPLVVRRAPATSEDPAAWGQFTDEARTLASAAKATNVTLAVRNAKGTLCESSADVRRLAKDVDSAWLRFALEPAAFGTPDESDVLLAKSVIAFHALERQETFAAENDDAAPALVRALARYRAFIVLERDESDPSRTAYHEALERFTALRSSALTVRSL